MKLNRSNYKVAVTSKKQAKQFKQALLALGEEVCPNYYEDDESHFGQSQLIYDTDQDNGGWLCYNNVSGLQGITFKELLTLIVNDVELVKPSLLDGKCAIEVSNEREFKLLMEYYESKGWKSARVASVTEIVRLNIKDPFFIWSYHDDFYALQTIHSKQGYKIIAFTDFAKELDIEVPVFILKSEDGFDLYEGDGYHLVSINFLDSKWEYKKTVGNPTISEHNPAYYKPAHNKAFSTKEAAEKWVAENNKPQSIKLHSDTKAPVTVYKNYVDFDISNKQILRCNKKEVEEIYAALNELQ